VEIPPHGSREGFPSAGSDLLQGIDIMSPTPVDAGGFDTYEKLIELVANYLGRNDMNERIPDFIHLTEVDLSRGLNLREQETSKEGTFSADQDYIEMPEDLQVPRNLRIDTSPIRQVAIVSMDKFSSIKQAYNQVLDPMAATLVGDRLMLTPTPGKADPYTLFYLGRLLPLSSSNTTNRILKDAPDALLYGALLHSAPYIGDDERTTLWGTMYTAFKEDYKRMEWRSRTAGGPLRVSPDFSVDDWHNSGGG
jgi:hypothetical protein